MSSSMKSIVLWGVVYLEPVGVDLLVDLYFISFCEMGQTRAYPGAIV